MHAGPIVSLQARILQQQASFPEATGTLSWILSALSISTKMIAAQVRRRAWKCLCWIRRSAHTCW